MIIEARWFGTKTGKHTHPDTHPQWMEFEDDNCPRCKPAIGATRACPDCGRPQHYTGHENGWAHDALIDTWECADPRKACAASRRGYAYSCNLARDHCGDHRFLSPTSGVTTTWSA